MQIIRRNAKVGGIRLIMAKARTCDRCYKTMSAEYKDDYYKFDISKCSIKYSGHSWLRTVELCEECLKEFNNFINNY